MVSVSGATPQLGSNFTITATFTNPGSATGYGPFIDLYIPHTGPDGVFPGTPASSQYDGISPPVPASNYTASYLGAALTVYTLNFPDAGGGTGCVSHPLALDTSGNFLQVCGVAGDQLVVVQLPFGSFTPGQPAATVSIPAYISPLADLGTSLSIRARGGFQFGATPTIDWCCTAPVDTTLLSDAGAPPTWAAGGSVTPTLISITKQTTPPEGEIATGPNFPQSFSITVNIAGGQTVDNLRITDDLPPNMVYAGGLLSTPAATSTIQPPIGSPSNPPDNHLELDYASVTGGAGPAITVTFDYYISNVDADGNSVIDPLTGLPNTSPNQAFVVGDWTPLDTRDPAVPGNASAGPGVATPSDKSIAVQKSVAQETPTANGPVPGNILRYTINFQISDFFAFDQLSIPSDIISDGQHFYVDAVHHPNLTIRTNTVTTAPVNFGSGNYAVACNYSGATLAECGSIDPGPPDGTTRVAFDISQQLIDSGINPDGQLLGGLVEDGGSADDGPTTGTIVFYTQILDSFTDIYPSGDQSVNQGDSLTNNVTIRGRLLDAATCRDGGGGPQACASLGGPTAGDTSAARAVIQKGSLTKSLYAHNGITCGACASLQVAPGDLVTYRVTYTILTGDYEKLTLTDFLPLPIFRSDDPDANGTAGPAWTKDTGGNPTPSVGEWQRGPSDTQFAAQAIDPAVTVSGAGANNSLKFDFGTFDDPANNSLKIDLLFTVAVTNTPFADKLFLTNQVQQQDQNTSNVASSTSAIVQLQITEPVLVTDKSAVSTNHPGITPVPAIPAPIVFAQPGLAGAPWSGGVISSTYLGANNGTIDADISGVFGGDLVKFAVIVQNTGSGLNGAFDIALHDTLPPGYVMPADPAAMNLQVYRGDGTLLDYTPLGDDPVDHSGFGGDATPDFFGPGIQINDPPVGDPEYGHGACQGHDATSGKNIVIITYDAAVDPAVVAGTVIVNQASLDHFASTEGGPNFLPAPLTDDATTTIATPTLQKVLTDTEIDNPVNSSVQAVIGELATYTLTVTVPQGITPDAALTDTLDAGLAFVDVKSVTYSAGVSAANPIGTGAAPGNVTIGNAGGGTGNRLTYGFGDLTDTNSDNAVDDTITIVYEAVVLDTTGNQSGTALNNAAALTWGAGGSVQQSAPTAVITVIEPALQVAKSVVVNGAGTSGDAGDSVVYTLIISQGPTSETDAFDVTLSDVIPADIQPSGFTVADTAALLTPANFSLAGNTLTTSAPFDFADAPARAITITVSAILKPSVTPNEVIANTANLQWTSLAGAIAARSIHNPDSGERTGTASPALDDYFASSAASLTISNIAPVKSLIASSEASTPGSDVTIGEIVRYRLAMNLPEGTSGNVVMTDTLPSGMSFIDPAEVRISFIADTPMTSAADLAAADNDAIPPTAVLPAARIALSGQTVTFSLGDFVNNDSDPNSETVLIDFNALVDNVIANTGGVALANTFSISINGDTPVVSNSVPVTIREANIILNSGANQKTATPATGDAGDTITYSVVFTAANGASNTTAFDVRLLDILPSSPAYASVTRTGSVNASSAGSCATGVDTSNSSGNTVDVRIAVVPVGCTVTVTYTATLDGTVVPAKTITNTANVTYTSLPGAGTTGNPTGSNTPGGSGASNGERDGSGVATPPDNYAASDSAVVTVNAVVPQKSIITTSEAHTAEAGAGTVAAPRLAAIGEIVRYRLVLQVPEGSIPDLQLQDAFGFVGAGSGQVFLNDGSARFAYVGSGSLSSGTYSSGNPDQVTGLACANIAGSLTLAQAASAASIPSASVNCAFNTDNISASEVADNDAYGINTAVRFKFGNLTNGDSTADPEFIIVEFNALVHNNTGANTNDVGDGPQDTLQARYLNPSTGLVANLGATANRTLRVVEPTLTLAKSVSIAATADAGDTVTYTLMVTSSAAANTATAFDLVVSDTLDTNLTWQNTAITSTQGTAGADYCAPGNVGAPANGAALFNTGSATVGQAVTATITCLDPGKTATVTITATINSSAPAGMTIYNDNTHSTPVQLIYTSLPASGTPNGSAGNATGSTIPGPSGATTGERNGTSTNPPNDYLALAGANTTLSTPTIVKQAPTPTRYAIGSAVTYPILVTLPEGVTRSLRVVDQIPPGMLYLGSSVDGSTFTGTLDATPAVSPAAPLDGDDITFDFGDTTATANNNATDNVFTLNVTVRVLDVPANQLGSTLINAALLRYVNPNTGADAPDVSGGTQTITITEPRIVTAKSVDKTTGVQAGDVLTYTVQFTNTGTPLADVSTSYDVSATDVLAQGLAFDSLTSCNLDTPATNLTALTTVDTSVVGQVTLGGAAWDVPPGSTITCVYTATVQIGAFLDGIHTNTVDGDWTSVNGPDIHERVYDDSVSRAVDGTQDTASAGFASDGLTLDKGVDVSQVAVGGTVTFTIAVHGPNGTIRSLAIADQLPAGLIYNNDAVFTGVSAPATTTVGSPNDGSAPVALDWDFGDAAKSAEPLTIVYSARAADVPGNLRGMALTNAVTLDHQHADGTAAAQLTAGATVTLTEPVITFAKTIVSLPSPLDAGGIVQYRISFANGSGANTSTAFDVHLTDTLPASLALSLPVAITLGGGAAGVADASAGNSLDVTIGSVPPGGTAIVDYSAAIQNSVSPGQIIANTSDASWTSLAGNAFGERTGVDGPTGSPDNYAASDGQSFTVTSGSIITKQLMATSASHTSGASVTIGEQVTYGILVTFSEGTTADDRVVDALPPGLAAVVGTPQIITSAAAASGLLSADFNGSLGTQDITIVPGDGGSVTFDFAQDATNVVVAGDNNPANNTILLSFQARITDVAGNVGFPVATTLSNAATNQVGAGPATPSNVVDVTVVEPQPVLTKAFANVTTPASGASGIVNETIRMTLTYQNTGTSNAYDVVITDAFDSTRATNLTPFVTPAGFTYSTSGVNPVTVRYAANPGVAVAPGDTLVFELDFKLGTGNAPGDVIADTAQVTATTTLDSSSADGDDANERNATTSASANLQFNGVELSIAKDDGGITATPGNNVSYTLTYQNYGNQDAANTTLNETVPAHTSYDAANNTTAWVCAGNPAPAGTACTFNLGTLTAGTGGSVTFVVTVDNPFPATITQIGNTATITADQPETIYSDNSATRSTTLSTAPGLNITKDDHLEIVAPDMRLSYDMRVSNTGNQDLANLVMVDTVPPGTTFVSASAGGSFDSGTGLITWPLYNLASGTSLDFTVVLKVDAMAALPVGLTSFSNDIHVQDDGTNTTGVPVESEATDTDELANTGVKTLMGTDQPGSADPNVLVGEILDYSIRIDVPDGTIRDLRAVDLLDHGLAFVGCDPTTPILAGSLVLEKNPCTDPTALVVRAQPVTDVDPNSVNAGRRVTFEFGRVQNTSGATQTLQVNYRVIVLDIADVVSGVKGLNNKVSWTWEGGSLPGAATGVDVVEPQLTIRKSVSPAVAVRGSMVTYTIEVAHAPESSAPAYDVLVTDDIPRALVLDQTSVEVHGSAALPAPAILVHAAQFSVEWAQFPLGATATITFRAQFAGPSPVINTAFVQWSSIQIDPGTHLQPKSPYNRHSTERRYDPGSQTLNDYRAGSSATLKTPRLPETGFAPGFHTVVPAQPPAQTYDALANLSLEIPALKLNMPVVGVPATAAGWDLTWLSDQAGYLEGTTYPGQVGTTAITGHVYLADGTPGPFVHLGQLKWGDRVVLHANGQRYIFEARENRVVLPTDLSIFNNDGYTWLTLLTCKDYAPSLKTYSYRQAVRAVLIKVEPEP